uniref:Uncharacterized protein n=1 Tax=Arundo donax TaxID=35708 RepID=A0A0A9G498_ARUDO
MILMLKKRKRCPTNQLDGLGFDDGEFSYMPPKKLLIPDMPSVCL